jgi:spore coat protein H
VLTRYCGILAVGLSTLASTVSPAQSVANSEVNSDDELLKEVFAGRIVLRLQIDIPRSEVRKLTGDSDNFRQRPSALGIVKENGRTYTNVAIHLKGGAGSYRPLDDDPGLTLNFSKNAPGQTFHGLTKLSLNNSVQDSTFLNDKICRELFNRAGVPTPRAGFTTVRLNGQSLGIHVLTEGFNKQFLRHYFKNVHGNLYQTHGNQEVTDKLDVNSGDDPENHSGLQALAQAISEGDTQLRWQKLEQTLDVDRFLSFIAMEIMLCHWDGYCMNQNNYRVFHDLGANKIVFIAHGMDQMFETGAMLLGGDKSSTKCPLFPEWHGAVADAVMSTPQGRKLYLQRVGLLYTNIFAVDALLKRVDELSSVVGAVIAESGPGVATNYQRRVNNLKNHIQARARYLAEQLTDAGKPHEAHPSAPTRLTGWTSRVQSGRPEFNQSTENGSSLLHISAAHGRAAGSWRTRIQLEPGRYRFEGEVRVWRVGPEGEEIGAGLRISGGRPRHELSGSTEWRKAAFEFQIGSAREVEFICELRAESGEAWFNTDKLQVVPADLP